jgi:hypothetical protein
VDFLGHSRVSTFAGESLIVATIILQLVASSCFDLDSMMYPALNCIVNNGSLSIFQSTHYSLPVKSESERVVQVLGL